jgi:hypothetical protein
MGSRKALRSALWRLSSRRLLPRFRTARAGVCVVRIMFFIGVIGVAAARSPPTPAPWCLLCAQLPRRLSQPGRARVAAARASWRDLSLPPTQVRGAAGAALSCGS